MTKAEARDKYLRDTYGISTEVYDAMFKAQGGVCAICLKPPKPGKRLHVDHDHKTDRVRGLLDWVCNHKFLGRRREDPDQHERAAAYLRQTFDWRTATQAPQGQGRKAPKAKARAPKVRLRTRRRVSRANGNPGQ